MSAVPGMEYVANAWEAYYTGDVQAATRDIESVIQTTEKVVHDVPLFWNTTGQLLIHLYLLAATAARDRMATSSALRWLAQAKQAAQVHGDVEVVLATYHHFFRTSMQAGAYSDALCSLEVATVYSGETHDLAARGTLYTDAGEVYATLANRDHSHEYSTYAENWFDKAEDTYTALGKDVSSQYTRFTLTRILNERASFYAHQGRKREAETALHRAGEALAPGNIRHQEDYLLASSGVAIAHGDVVGACEHLRLSLTLHRTTNSLSNVVYMRRDLEHLKRMEPGNSAVQMIEDTIRIQSREGEEQSRS